MILFALFVIALATLVGVLLHWDLRAADAKRRAREAARRRRGVAELLIELDVTPFVQAMNRAARELAKVDWAATQATLRRFEQAWARRCRWCRVLAAIGLSHHAAHYVPRHRAVAR